MALEGQDLRPDRAARASRRRPGCGAAYLGFVFYPPSPRSLDPAQARELAAAAPAGVGSVGVVVDPSDAELDRAAGRRAARRPAAARPRDARAGGRDRAASGCRVIKALRIEPAEDLAPVPAYAEVADMLLFDAKPPRDARLARRPRRAHSTGGCCRASRSRGLALAGGLHRRQSGRGRRADRGARSSTSRPGSRAGRASRIRPGSERFLRPRRPRCRLRRHELAA